MLLGAGASARVPDAAGPGEQWIGLAGWNPMSRFRSYALHDSVQKGVRLCELLAKQCDRVHSCLLFRQ